ncbi:AAA family ATPase [Pantoea agglomerans]|uniref:AAA family ATPase n=1 Tax=Enterobacter agglomerans TaxID=549 RepID=UPI003EDB11BF
MIKKIKLQYFKCFKDIKIELNKLTLLSGENASGKSSFIQSILTLHQTMGENEWSTKLLLNGKNVNLGTVSDVVDKINGRNNLSISVENEIDSFSWWFSGERSNLSMEIKSVEFNGRSLEKPEKLQFLSPTDFSGNMLIQTIKAATYIKAERSGPRDLYPLKDDGDNEIGSAGENSISVLYNFKDNIVDESIELKNQPPTLFHQVQERMRIFFPGFEFKLDPLEKINFVTLGIRTAEDTDFHRPVNVGFGITQVLPIVISCLSAKKNDLIIIENPEVHLHPKGQTQMGEFLAEVANSGVQIIIESHSDHILNGIRKAVKQKIIDHEDTAFYFFNKRSCHESQVISPQIDKNGIIDHWPNGFFDQFDKDISYLAGWGG